VSVSGPPDVSQAVRDLYRADPEKAKSFVEAATGALEEEQKLSASKKRQGAEKAAFEGRHLRENMVHQVFGTAVEEVYRMEGRAPLGTGLSGTVVRVRHRQTGELFAMKSLKLQQHHKQQGGTGLEELKAEIKIMSGLDHPNVVRLFEAYYTKTRVHLIMELCSGGEMYDRLMQAERYDEIIAKEYVRKILSATRYLHEHGVVHRDLKLENVLFESNEPDAQLKLCDFGLSQHFFPGEHMHTMLGTPYYLAPEVLKGDYDEKVDCWSIGVIAFMLLSGTPPFAGSKNSEILQAVAAGIPSWDATRWDTVSSQAREFVKSMLTVDREKRPSALEALRHPWLESAAAAAVEQRRSAPVLKEVVDNLQAFKDYSKLRRLGLEVVAFSLDVKQIKALREEFEKFDEDGNGEIEISEFRDILQKSDQLDSQSVESIFASIDVDHKGTIHWRTFVGAAMDICEVDDAHLRVAFQRLDYTKNGFIERRDLEELMGEDLDGNEIKAMFSEIQTDRVDEKQFIELCRVGSIQRKTSMRKLSMIRDIQKITAIGEATSKARGEAAPAPSNT